MSLGQDSRLPDRRVLGKFLRSQHWPSFITPSRFKVPAHSDPLKCWNFRKADWKRFCLLTHQILRRHARISTRAHFLRLSNVSHQAVGRTMYHAGTKSARPSIAPLFERQWGLPLTEPACPYSLDYNIRNRSDGRKLSTPSTSRTLAARRGEPSTNLLAVWTLRVPHLGKFHRFAIGEERGTQDQRPRAHQACQQGAVRPMEDSNT